MTGRRIARTAAALRGALVSPTVAGLAFVPSTALADPNAGGSAPSGLLAGVVGRAGLDFAFVDASGPEAAAGIAALHETGAAALRVVGGVLWPVLDRLGVDDGLRATAVAPASLADALDAATSSALAVVDEAVAQAADGIVITDDLAGASGPLVAPDFVADELVPRYDRIVSAARENGLVTVLHADGDARALMRALARARIDAIHGAGAPSVEVAATAARRAGITFMGGVPTPELSAGPASALRAGAVAGTLAAAGRFALCDDGGITTREQFLLLLEALSVARDAAGED